jgi:outer membrane protein assembly factor BamD
MRMNKYLSILFLFIILTSCSEYQKAFKSEDVALKYEVAEKMYDNKKYSKAIKLFEQIGPMYKGKPQAEKLFYMYAQSYYKTKQYYLSGYQFESFVASYPKSEKVEEAAFLGADSYSKLSVSYSLDQVDTYKAIDKLQSFIDKYPNSEFLPVANAKVKELNEKLEKKAFEVAKQYNTIYDYKASMVAMDNFLIDFPGTYLKEDAMYWKFNSAYKLAVNSIQAKMEERLHTAKEIFEKFEKTFPDSKFKSEASEMMNKINNDLQQFSK